MDNKREKLFPNLLCNIIIPVLLLTQGSRFIDSPAWVLILALCFPIGYFFYDLRKRDKVNVISIIGFVSVLLTGGIGLLELPRFWFIVKEAAVPGVIGIVVLVSLFTPYPLVRTLLFSKQIFRVDVIQDTLRARGNEQAMERLLTIGTVGLAASFFFSAVLNFFVASHFIQTEPSINQAQFNAEVGAMTGWSFLIIALPSMVMLMGIMFYILNGVQKLTGLKLEELVHDQN
ncbi:MAG: MFS transporter [Verrucomicrobia bacterium]|nr:MFS transporter [Verrucomicrobiota bacterium]